MKTDLAPTVEHIFPTDEHLLGLVIAYCERYGIPRILGFPGEAEARVVKYRDGSLAAAVVWSEMGDSMFVHGIFQDDSQEGIVGAAVLAYRLDTEAVHAKKDLSAIVNTKNHAMLNVLNSRAAAWEVTALCLRGRRTT